MTYKVIISTMNVRYMGGEVGLELSSRQSFGNRI